jgi:hypothetical protein
MEEIYQKLKGSIGIVVYEVGERKNEVFNEKKL